jgi:hypothetical protein
VQVGDRGRHAAAERRPARSFGPAPAAGEWSDFWICVAGPVAGAVLGALAYQFVRGDRPPGAGRRRLRR